MVIASGVQCRTVSAQDKFPPASAHTPSTSNSSADKAVLTHTTPHPIPEPTSQHRAALCATPREKNFLLWEKKKLNKTKKNTKSMNTLMNR